MKFSLLSTALLASFCINKSEALWKGKVGSTWNYVLGHKINLATEKAEVLEIDVNKSAELIQEYHDAGKKVICYFSGGTIEDFRDDVKEYEAVDGLVRNVYEAWDDERWLDFRIEGIKPLIKRRMQLAVSKKCDGIEVDNVDAYQISEVKDEWDDPITREQTVVFLKWLGTTAHNLGIAIGLKNVNGLIDEVTQYFDFAVSEDCHQYNNECRRYRNFLDSGKPVFAVAYNGLSKNRSKLCEQLDGVSDISMIVKETGKLVQEGTIFNYQAECKKSGAPKTTNKVTTTKKTTTVKKTTTTTTKKTTVVKKTTTTAKKTTVAKKITTIKKTTVAKKTTTVPKSVKKTTTKNVAPKATTTKKAVVVKKTTTKKAVAKKTTTKKAVSKKTTTKKAVAKTTTKKTATKKSVSKVTSVKTTPKLIYKSTFNIKNKKNVKKTTKKTAKKAAKKTTKKAAKKTTKKAAKKNTKKN